MRTSWAIAAAALLLPLGVAADPAPLEGAPIEGTPPPSQDAPPPPTMSAGPAELKLSDTLRYQVDPEAYSIINAVKGLSTHKPMVLYPLTWSPEFHDRQTEVVFTISAKQKLLELWGNFLFFGYSQKSFWQLYDTQGSAPFRSTDYNPELFYRWVPDPKVWHRWGADFGFEHESNGRPFPDSRSWNRLVFAPFHARGRHLLYMKFWYRIPEGAASTAADPTGDDNPEISDYYGYSEFTYSRQIGGKQLLTGWLRGNVRTGKGAGSVTWSVPSDDGYVFWAVSVFHGYGENLLDHDRSTSRVMAGVMLSR